ncbi:hypothetical protein ACU8KH_01618 [Lachancea thermotolerans]
MTPWLITVWYLTAQDLSKNPTTFQGRSAVNVRERDLTIMSS